MNKQQWKEVWPDYCKACGGWGAFGGDNGTYDHPPDPVDPCDFCTNADPMICARCGKEGLSEDGDGPCSFCQWDYNDGVDLYHE